MLFSQKIRTFLKAADIVMTANIQKIVLVALKGAGMIILCTHTPFLSTIVLICLPIIPGCFYATK